MFLPSRTDTTASRDAVAAAPGAGGLFVDVARSELAKLFTVRATYLGLAFTVLLTVGAAVGLCEAYVHHVAQLSLTQLNFNPTSYSLSGVLLAQLSIGTLGVLVISGEHASGLIRATFAAVPQRRVVLAAKATVFASVGLVVGELSSFLAFEVGQAILVQRHVAGSLGDPGVLRAVVGAGLYLTLLGVLALCIGAIVRHTAAAITTLFGILLVLPAMTEGLPGPLQHAINPYLPGYAGQAIFHTSGDTSHLLAPWPGFTVFCAYTLLALILAAAAINRDLG